MRRTIVTSLALALTLGVASVSNAQQAQRGERDGRRGGAEILFKGIELTDQQKELIKALHQKQAAGVDKAQFQKKHEEVKAARERGDTATLRAFRSQMQEQMKQRHETMLTGVRGILTPAQLEIFEKNVVAGKERMKDRMEDGKGWHGEKRGKRGERAEGHAEHKS